MTEPGRQKQEARGKPVMRSATAHTPQISGFTLIELMVVVVVIALAAGLGGGVYVGSYKRMMVEKAARDVWSLAKYARIAAIEKQQTLYLEIDRTNRRCWVGTAEVDANSVSAAEGGMIRNQYCRPVELPSGVEIEELAVGVSESADVTAGDAYPRIIFRPNGSAESAAIGIGDGKTHYGITINGATGTSRLVLGEAAPVADLTIDLEARE
jgi:prepilin-type N-terminal cleavage/methylation domain-containing protein